MDVAVDNRGAGRLRQSPRGTTAAGHCLGRPSEDVAAAGRPWGTSPRTMTAAGEESAGAVAADAAEGGREGRRCRGRGRGGTAVGDVAVDEGHGGGRERGRHRCRRGRGGRGGRRCRGRGRGRTAVGDVAANDDRGGRRENKRQEQSFDKCYLFSCKLQKTEYLLQLSLPASAVIDDTEEGSIFNNHSEKSFLQRWHEKNEGDVNDELKSDASEGENDLHIERNALIESKIKRGDKKKSKLVKRIYLVQSVLQKYQCK